MAPSPASETRAVGLTPSGSQAAGIQTSATTGESGSFTPTPTTPTPSAAPTAEIETVYAVFVCSGVEEFLNDAKLAGFQLWVPYLRVRRVHAKIDKISKARTLEVTIEQVLAMPGYVFCPLDWWEQVMYWASDKYNLRLCLSSAGSATATMDRFASAKIPAEVSGAELELMQMTCNDLGEELNDLGEALPVLEVLEPDDAVVFLGHALFTDAVTATVVRCRPTGFVRVHVTSFDRYVEVHRKFLRKNP